MTLKMHNMVRTDYVFPPIPTRNFDWCAWLDGDEESGRCGYGRTKDEAIAELRELIEEETDSCPF